MTRDPATGKLTGVWGGFIIGSRNQNGILLDNGNVLWLPGTSSRRAMHVTVTPDSAFQWASAVVKDSNLIKVGEPYAWSTLRPVDPASAP